MHINTRKEKSRTYNLNKNIRTFATFKRLVKTELYNRAYLCWLVTTRTCDSSLCEWLNVRHQLRNNNNNNNAENNGTTDYYLTGGWRRSTERLDCRLNCRKTAHRRRLRSSLHLLLVKVPRAAHSRSRMLSKLTRCCEQRHHTHSSSTVVDSPLLTLHEFFFRQLLLQTDLHTCLA